jgi:serine/threonine protein phosphatase 1
MIYCIPDIHGRYDLFTKAMYWIDKTLTPEDTLVFLGDYVDRGPKSAEVIRDVRNLSFIRKYKIITLLGNHEQMMRENMDGWLHNGGEKTLQSYKHLYGEEWWTERLNQDKKWMKSLRLYYQVGKYIFVHANVDPTLPLDKQELTMLWDRHYMSNPIPGKIVVHGHTPIVGHEVKEGRVNLDGGANWTNKLNLGIFDDNGLVRVKVFGENMDV